MWTGFGVSRLDIGRRMGAFGDLGWHLCDSLTQLPQEFLAHWVNPPYGLHQIFLPELNLHSALGLQDTPPGQRSGEGLSTDTLGPQPPAPSSL